MNQTKAGVTIHIMDENIDTGNIVKQIEVDYSFDDTAESLYKKLEKAQLELFKETWPNIRDGNIEAFPQKGKPSYHVKKDFMLLRRIHIKNNEIDVIGLINYIKAMTFPPFNNAYIEINNKKYFIELNIKTKGCDVPDSLLKQYEEE